MDGMDAREALNDIAERCGLSTDIIKRVQKAETEHVIAQLKKGNRVSLPGRGTYRVEFKNKLMIGGTMGKVLNPTFKVSSVIESALAQCTGFIQDTDKSEEELPDGILLMQIPSLI